MKKQLTTLFLVAAALLMPLALTSCDEELQISEKVGSEPKPQTETVFSSQPGDTRTTIDDAGLFYWQASDLIWVDESNSFGTSSTRTTLGSTRRDASFLFNKSMTASSYNLIYTGSNATYANRMKVTIAAKQLQNGFDNAEHIGTSGDCATATASPTSSGNYSFTLNHKAHYLVLQPYKSSAINDDWKLVSIEITDYNGNALWGTYDFSMSGLSNPTNTGSTVLVTMVNSAGTSTPVSLPTSATRSVYAVIAPSSTTRNLRIRYTIKPTGSVNGTTGSTFVITKDLTRTFSTNGVTKIQHELSATSYSTMLFHMWDASVPYWVSEAESPTTFGASHTNYPSSSNSARWYNTRTSTTVIHAWHSAASLPNVNAATWYVMDGDPRWDSTGEAWCFNGNYAKINTLGAWFLKWAHITGTGKLNSGDLLADFRNQTSTAPGTDGVQHNGLTTTLGETYINTSTNYRTKGRPAPSEINKYFFVPALSHIYKGQLNSQHGCYWTATYYYYNAATDPQAYRLAFDEGKVVVSKDSREYGRPASTRPDGTPWFQ